MQLKEPNHPGYLRKITCSCMKSIAGIHRVDRNLSYTEYLNINITLLSIRFTWLHIEINAGVKALLSGVVPKNRTMQNGLTFSSQSLTVKAADLANKDVLPQPPSPNKTRGLSHSLSIYCSIRDKLSSRP